MSAAPVRRETRTSIISVIAFAAAVRASGAERARDATATEREEEAEKEVEEEEEEGAPLSSPEAATGHIASAAPAASAASQNADAGAMALPRTTCARSQEAVSGRDSSASKRASWLLEEEEGRAEEKRVESGCGEGRSQWRARRQGGGGADSREEAGERGGGAGTDPPAPAPAPLEEAKTT